MLLTCCNGWLQCELQCNPLSFFEDEQIIAGLDIALPEWQRNSQQLCVSQKQGNFVDFLRLLRRCVEQPTSDAGTQTELQSDIDTPVTEVSHNIKHKVTRRELTIPVSPKLATKVS